MRLGGLRAATTSVEIEGEKIRICSWHKKLFGDYGTLEPPTKTRKAVSEVDPLPDEDGVPTLTAEDVARLTNGNGKPEHVESPRTLRYEVGDTPRFLSPISRTGLTGQATR